MIPIGKITGKRTVISQKMGDGTTPTGETFELHQLVGESGMMLVFGPDDRWVVRMNDVVEGVIRFRAAMQRAEAMQQQEAANATKDGPSPAGPEKKPEPINLSDMDPRRVGSAGAGPDGAGGDKAVGAPEPERDEETGPGAPEGGERGGRTAYPPPVT